MLCTRRAPTIANTSPRTNSCFSGWSFSQAMNSSRLILGSACPMGVAPRYGIDSAILARTAHYHSPALVRNRPCTPKPRSTPAATSTGARLPPTTPRTAPARRRGCTTCWRRWASACRASACSTWARAPASSRASSRGAARWCAAPTSHPGRSKRHASKRSARASSSTSRPRRPRPARTPTRASMSSLRASAGCTSTPTAHAPKSSAC